MVNESSFTWLAIGKTRVYVSYPETDKLAICSILHITSVESLQAT